MTASEVANATGLRPREREHDTVQARQTGEVTKATRGYQLADQSKSEA